MAGEPEKTFVLGAKVVPNRDGDLPSLEEATILEKLSKASHILGGAPISTKIIGGETLVRGFS